MAQGEGHVVEQRGRGCYGAGEMVLTQGGTVLDVGRKENRSVNRSAAVLGFSGSQMELKMELLMKMHQKIDVLGP